MHSAHERQRNNVSLSLIGWPYTQNDLWVPIVTWNTYESSRSGGVPDGSGHWVEDLQLEQTQVEVTVELSLPRGIPPYKTEAILM